jgi:hypothetical protein
MIEVEQDQRQRAAIAAHAADLERQLALQVAAVVNSRQPIGVAELLEFDHRHVQLAVRLCELPVRHRDVGGVVQGGANGVYRALRVLYRKEGAVLTHPVDAAGDRTIVLEGKDVRALPP